MEVPPDAGLDEIKSAFRRLAFQLHPDFNPDDPDATKKFHRLSEAYAVLRAQLEDEVRQTNTDDSERAHRAYRRHQREAGEPGGDSKAKAENDSRNRQRPKAERQTTSAPNSGPARPGAWFERKDEVLRDVLKDPFARQVFEEIYAHVQGKGGAPNTLASPQPGLWTRLRERVQRGLDVTHSLRLPLSELHPGRTLRITLKRGLRGHQTLDVRLPADFHLGRPIRLRGLGRKLGPLRGDLYLDIQPL